MAFLFAEKEDCVKIQKIQISKLKAAEYNPRIALKAGDKEYEKLKRSIQEFGFVEPIIWNEQTGNVVGGHQRLTVLRDLGETEIDCVIVDLEEQKEKALNVALNNINDIHWITSVKKIRSSKILQCVYLHILLFSLQAF